MRITDVLGLADILKIKESTILYLARKNKIPSFKIGKHRRFDVEQVLKASLFNKEKNGRST